MIIRLQGRSFDTLCFIPPPLFPSASPRFGVLSFAQRVASGFKATESPHQQKRGVEVGGFRPGPRVRHSRQMLFRRGRHFMVRQYSGVIAKEDRGGDGLN